MPLPTLTAALALLAGLTVSADEFTFFHENVMGTSLELRVRADTADAARRAEGRVLGEVDRLGAILSNHDPASEFRRWQAGPKAPAAVSPELLELLAECDRWRALSGGAFEPGVQALTRLWQRSAEAGRVPDPAELAAAVASYRGPAWRLDPRAGTAERLGDGPLSLDAIAKGFILERACAAGLAAGEGVRGLLLNVGGDLRAQGDFSATIGIVRPTADSEAAEPLARIEVRDRAVATSGSSQRGFSIGGVRYSHILDPRTGRPAEGATAATVVAERSADADALATVLNVLTPAEGLRLAGSIPGVEALIVAADGRVEHTPGWPALERPRPGPAAELAQAEQAQAPAPAHWGDAFELAVAFEVNNPDTGGERYRRPYVAIWVEDEKGFPVRNLLLWVSMGGSGPFQWLPDLKRWYRVDQLRKQTDKRDMVLTIARPTRPPGKYSVVWDGKDDRGRPLPPGAYTLTIDAAREHGTYQSIRKRVTIADTPFTEELPGNVEIRSASIAYRRKPAAQ